MYEKKVLEYKKDSYISCFYPLNSCFTLLLFGFLCLLLYRQRRNIMEKLKQLYEQTVGEEIDKMELIIGSGSNRKYYRLHSKTHSLIGVIGTSVEENRAFVSMTRHFSAKNLPVPHLYAVSADERCYLQEDLGTVSLFNLITTTKRDEREPCGGVKKSLLYEVMTILPHFQVRGAEDFDFSVCYPQECFNRRSVMWDLNYFKYNFLKPLGVDFQEDRLEDDFDKLADLLLSVPGETFLYRDFQSRNVMMKDGMPYFIDYQGGRKGALHYDVASFLWQAKANYNSVLREELVDVYLSSLKNLMEVDEKEFKLYLNYFALFRTLQVLGAYGFRGYFEQKTHFIESIPYALNNLKLLLHEIDRDKFGYLSQLLTAMVSLPQFDKKEHTLTVTVCSFSYLKGLPTDTSGNGGGYLFDCRAIHNPGRYDAYKKQTGMDIDVIRFLEDDGEITQFLDNAKKMVDASVSRYLERGFTNLMVGFGCTGGQHRSVYAAEQMAKHLHQQFGIAVQLYHREQGIKKSWEKRTENTQSYR